MKKKEGWNYLVVKKPSYIIMTNNINTSWRFLLFELPHSFRTENKLKFHEKVCKNKDFCGIVMRS